MHSAPLKKKARYCSLPLLRLYFPSETIGDVTGYASVEDHETAKIQKNLLEN